MISKTRYFSRVMRKRDVEALVDRFKVRQRRLPAIYDPGSTWYEPWYFELRLTEEVKRAARHSLDLTVIYLVLEEPERYSPPTCLFIKNPQRPLVTGILEQGRCYGASMVFPPESDTAPEAANADLQATWSYHDTTKHSYRSVRANPHYLDWENRPLPFKTYTSLEPIFLPQDLSPSKAPALREILATGNASEVESVPDLKMLAQLLYFSAGITKRRTYSGGEMLFRAAACTGALYHIDLYVICSDLPGLEAGVYHFGVHDFALRRLRSGDFRSEVARAVGGNPVVSHAPALVACASTYWRNAWKYQARAYRHCFWDNGTILANLLALAAAHDLPARLLLGFVDASISQLLGLDEKREGALSLVALGRAPDRVPRESPPVEPLALETTPLSGSEVDYPAIRAMHSASSLARRKEVATWQGTALSRSPAEPSGQLFPLAALAESELPTDSIEQVIRRRGSTREFALEPIMFTQLTMALRYATLGIPADVFDSPGAMLNDFYLIVNAVEGLPSGAYFYHHLRQALELLKEGDFRSDAGYLGLGQTLPATASVDIFLLTDLGAILERFGNRGYRAAQLEAGIVGGRLYLAAYAQRLGASGLTFYDDDVTTFFSPHAEGKSVMFLIALGKSARRSTSPASPPD